VLAAFQRAEDYLASLRLLTRQIKQPQERLHNDILMLHLRAMGRA
jgi:hypothetical protein